MKFYRQDYQALALRLLKRPNFKHHVTTISRHFIAISLISECDLTLTIAFLNCGVVGFEKHLTTAYAINNCLYYTILSNYAL